MWSLIASLFTQLSRGWLKNVLTGAGIMLASYTAVMSAFNLAVQSLRSNFSSVSGDILALLSLAGFDVSISIIVGAIATRITLNQQKLFFKKM